MVSELLLLETFPLMCNVSVLIKLLVRMNNKNYVPTRIKNCYNYLKEQVTFFPQIKVTLGSFVSNTCFVLIHLPWFSMDDLWAKPCPPPQMKAMVSILVGFLSVGLHKDSLTEIYLNKSNLIGCSKISINFCF